ncbi:MAG: hypothetical protein ACRD9Q_03000, partial [Nitrososphaeraceae archaeon]
IFAIKLLKVIFTINALRSILMNNHSEKWDKVAKKRSNATDPYTYDASERTRRILVNLSFLGLAGLFFYLIFII